MPNNSPFHQEMLQGYTHCLTCNAQFPTDERGILHVCICGDDYMVFCIGCNMMHRYTSLLFGPDEGEESCGYFLGAWDSQLGVAVSDGLDMDIISEIYDGLLELGHTSIDEEFPGTGNLGDYDFITAHLKDVVCVRIENYNGPSPTEMHLYFGIEDLPENLETLTNIQSRLQKLREELNAEEG